MKKRSGDVVFLRFFVVILCINLFVGLVPLFGVTNDVGAVKLSNVPDDAVRIKTAVELAGIGGARSEGKYFVLENDIDLVEGWIAIDDFRGTFDGQGYSINNLYMLENSDSMFAGLFGLINVDGVTIKNVGVNLTSVGVNANFNFGYIGGLVGYIHGDATIRNCYVTGNLIIVSSYGGASAGGLIGCSNGDVVVANCYVTGDVSATGSGASVGGLIGCDGNSTIVKNCYTTGTISAISNSIYRDASAYAGGLIGYSGGYGNVELINSYATGDVITKVATDNAFAGGLIGRSSGGVTVESCYRLSTQKISGTTINDAGKPLSSRAMKIPQSFTGWDFETIWALDVRTNRGYPYLRDPITDSDIADDNTPKDSSRFGFLPKRLAVVHIKTAEELSSIGGAKSAGKYYVLDNDIDLIDEWVPIYDFRGTFDGQGYSINNLYVLSTSKREDAGLFGWTTVDGVTIKNVGVNIGSKGLTASTVGGLISLINAGSVMNCYVTGNVTSTGGVVGGLIGWSSGEASVMNCYVTGNIAAISTSYAGRVFAGGLVGYSQSGAVVMNSYVTGDITITSLGHGGGYDYVCAGGLIGYSGYGSVTVKNSYTTGDITATSTGTLPVFAGGLVGYSWVGGIAVENSYTTGDITTSGFYGTYAGGLASYSDDGIVTKNCYRLSSQKIIGDTINEAGNVLTPEEMKNQKSFIGWNFERIWAIDADVNEGYPYLNMALIMGDEGDLFGSFWFIALLIVMVALLIVGIVWVLLHKKANNHLKEKPNNTLFLS